MIFGITTALILPICDVSDEIEHLARAEITSQGVIIPHWTGDDMGVEGLYNHTEGERISSEKNVGAGYNSIRAYNFFSGSLGKTVFQTSYDTAKIDTTPFIIDSAFEQNPFFGYLPQAIGIFLAKLLDLNVIWLLWLARICNLVFYAGVVSLAIKKAPVLKLPLLNNLGSITGGMTSTPALGTLISTAKTDDVASAYASTYPIALILIVLASQLMITLI